MPIRTPTDDVEPPDRTAGQATVTGPDESNYFDRLGELQHHCELILGSPLDKSSFRRKLDAKTLVEPIKGEMRGDANDLHSCSGHGSAEHQALDLASLSPSSRGDTAAHISHTRGRATHHFTIQVHDGNPAGSLVSHVESIDENRLYRSRNGSGSPRPREKMIACNAFGIEHSVHIFNITDEAEKF